MPTPIGLAGPKGSGKDASFQFIHEWAEERGVIARRRGFADAVKFSFARMFIPDCSVDEAVIWCDEIKFTGTLEIGWARGELATGTRSKIVHEISGRTALQRFATEGHRDIFGEDFWLDILLPVTMMFDENDLPVAPHYPTNFMHPLDQVAPDLCVMTDTRFKNEAERINLLNGFVIKIERPGLPEDGDDHRSEAGLDSKLIHSVIVNDGYLGDLEEDIQTWCEEFLGPIYPPATVFDP